MPPRKPTEWSQVVGFCCRPHVSAARGAMQRAFSETKQGVQQLLDGSGFHWLASHWQLGKPVKYGPDVF